MSGMLNIRFLTILLVSLLLAKFLIMPMISWQGDAISELSLEKGRLQKMRDLVDSEDQLFDLEEAYDAELAALEDTLYKDTELLKISAQTELMEVILASELSVRSFSWVLDKAGSYRTLRAKISYTGAFKDSIQMLWTLDASPRMFSIVDSSHMIKSQSQDSLGVIEGFVTLELYALGESDAYGVE